MKRGGLILVLLMAWFAAACTVVVVEVAPGQYDVSLATRAASTATVTPTDAPSITPTTTDINTDTPTATFTPTRTPTATSQPTNTAVPTDINTDIPSTPTPEITTLPPVTPGVPKTCELMVTGGRNVRSGPGTEYAKVGSRVQGDVITVDLFQTDTDGVYLWGRMASSQWVVVLDWTSYLWWVWAIEDDNPCDEVNGYPYGLVLPTQRPSTALDTMYGVKAVPGAGWGELESAGEILKAAGITPAVSVVQEPGMATYLNQRGWFVNFVPWSAFPGDCPTMFDPPDTSARLRVAYVERQLGGAEFDVVTLSNECTFPSAQYLNDWILSAVRECNERGWHCVPTVHYTGSPEIDWLTTMRPALTAMKQGGHMLGINIYPYYPVKLMTRNNDTQYTTYRFELIQAALVRGSDPAIIVTEIAESGGGEYPDLADMIAFAKVIDGKVLVADYWYFGPPLGAWPRATLNGRVEELARGIVAALH